MQYPGFDGAMADLDVQINGGLCSERLVKDWLNGHLNKIDWRGNGSKLLLASNVSVISVSHYDFIWQTDWLGRRMNADSIRVNQGMSRCLSVFIQPTARNDAVYVKTRIQLEESEVSSIHSSSHCLNVMTIIAGCLVADQGNMKKDGRRHIAI